MWGVSKTGGRGRGVSFFFGECCFRFRVRVRVGGNRNPNPNP